MAVNPKRAKCGCGVPLFPYLFSRDKIELVDLEDPATNTLFLKRGILAANPLEAAQYTPIGINGYTNNHDRWVLVGDNQTLGAKGIHILQMVLFRYGQEHHRHVWSSKLLPCGDKLVDKEFPSYIQYCLECGRIEVWLYKLCELKKVLAAILAVDDEVLGKLNQKLLKTPADERHSFSPDK